MGVPEECAFGASTLGAVLAGFSGLDSQVIITSPIAPAAVPAGWMVIDTTRGDHTSGIDPMIGTTPAPAAIQAPVVPEERAP